MSYLQPPPDNAPVIVTKDVGGYVNEYRAQTELYRSTHREVRLHECRSACTLALSLPNVCVYPTSLLKFHKAYNPETKVANEDVSNELMSSYPPAVQQRLGGLTRQYQVLTGAELIRLGMRNCEGPRQPEIMIARAHVKPQPTQQDAFSSTFSGILAALTPGEAPGAPNVAPVSGAQVRMQRVKAAPSMTPPANIPPANVQIASAAAAPVASPPAGSPASAPLAAPPANTPIPPVAPSTLYPASTDPQAAGLPAQNPPPLPPVRPAELAPQRFALASNWRRPIAGSTPILVASRFTPFAWRSVAKD